MRNETELTMPDDLQGARAFMALSRRFETTGLSRFELRRLGSIANAIEIQFEEGYGNSDPVLHLIKALHAVTSTYQKTTASNIASVIKKMESLVSKMEPRNDAAD